MHHPMAPWGPQLERRVGFSWAKTFVPGGAKDVFIKIKETMKDILGGQFWIYSFIVQKI